MKFGKNLRENTLKEWCFYAVDYKALKRSLKLEQQQDDSPGTNEFFRLLTESEHKLDKFYHDKEKWAVGYMRTLEERVEALRDASYSYRILVRVQSGLALFGRRS
jgi:SPX domain protein involved in polyphosphate accumulation